MIFNKEAILYLISNLFRIYIIFRFANIFFDRTKVNKKIESIAYVAYYILNSIMYLWFSYPFINLVVNIGVYFILTHIYQSKFPTRLIATILIYSITFFCEGIGFFILQQEHAVDLIIAASAISNICMFVLVLLFERFVKVKNIYGLSRTQCASMFCIPTLSIFVIIVISFTTDNRALIFLNTFCMLAIDVLVFYIYDNLIKSYAERYEKEIIKQQNEAYMLQLQAIEQSQKQSSLLNHDMKNHVLSLRSMVETDEKQKALIYLDDMMSTMKVSGQYVKSGNGIVDSILNYKIQEASRQDIEVIIEIQIPDQMEITPFDCSTILGNLLDNAIEASKQAENKFIRLKMSFEQNILYIQIENSFCGKILWNGRRLQSTKENSTGYGIGLNSVKQIVEKYHGELKIYDKDSKFIVQILLYNKKTTSFTNNI